MSEWCTDPGWLANDQQLAILEGVLARWDHEVLAAQIALEVAVGRREQARQALQAYEEAHN